MTLEYIETAELHLAFEERGPAAGTPVLMIHGLPDDARSWTGVAEVIAALGYRTICPYLRGIGATRFRTAEAARCGPLGVHVADMIEAIDVLDLDAVILIGHGYGASIAQGVAVLRPHRVARLISLGSYALGGSTASPQVMRARWYRWLLQTEEGMDIVSRAPEQFCAYLWQVWSPSWRERGPAFDGMRSSLRNPDFPALMCSAYRSSAACGKPAAALIEARITHARIAVPTVVLVGVDDASGRTADDDVCDDRYFARLTDRRALVGVGHFVHRESPDSVVRALLATAEHSASDCSRRSR
ncbi:alpha/beta fold hydrolase [Nocardia iowensis]|uniref:Alpha/beta hydrolase n=1 Tax=Nocardia iowensis TaxID=204891 RepID=A0ABX8RXY5_NOCIO|nr:alpha/beta hydrolase [Nocardia iowensis]QXN93215.1 alpha/beta hydrolase [Nocardia iowensis]